MRRGRGGLVAPWTAVAPLVALATDPAEDLRAKAMKLLKQVGGGAGWLGAVLAGLVSPLAAGKLVNPPWEPGLVATGVCTVWAKQHGSTLYYTSGR